MNCQSIQQRLIKDPFPLPIPGARQEQQENPDRREHKWQARAWRGGILYASRLSYRSRNARISPLRTVLTTPQGSPSTATAGPQAATPSPATSTAQGNT